MVWWLVWLFLALGQTLLFCFTYGTFVDFSITDSLLSQLIYSGIAMALWYPLIFFNQGKLSPAVLTSNILAGGAITVIVWIALTRFTMLSLFNDDTRYLEYWNATFFYRIGIGVFIYGLVILTYFLFITLTNLSEKNARQAKLETLVKETELKMLRSQINPHFLFNSLNSISSLTVTDPEKARTMVIKLSDFMRYTLSRKDEEPVSLSSELENLRLYLDIEKVRFGNKLVTEDHINKNSLEVKLPVMLLQPLYENAVKHGVYESTGQVKISTTATVEKDHLNITIANNFEPQNGSAGGTGTGLLNVSRRLELFYGRNASLITSKDNGIFTVRLFIPVKYSV